MLRLTTASGLGARLGRENFFLFFAAPLPKARIEAHNSYCPPATPIAGQLDQGIAKYPAFGNDKPVAPGAITRIEDGK